MKTKYYDILVIGAGPAGLMAADTAAKEGLNVLITCLLLYCRIMIELAGNNIANYFFMWYKMSDIITRRT